MRDLIIYRNVKLWACMLMITTACIESYDLPIDANEINFLVVDGFLNNENGKVTVNLKRAVAPSELNIPFEAHAVIALVDVDGNTYPLNELDSGAYEGIAPSIEVGLQYQLLIKTMNGKEYRSAFVTLKPTPQIKALRWKALSDGTQIMLDTEDETNQTRFYRWTIEETWEYHARYISYFKAVVGDTAVLIEPRGPDEMIDVCYQIHSSPTILTTSTKGLTQDKVNGFELVFLPKGTEKLGYRYSITVKQYAISAETYAYLEKLKTTAQELGALFSPQPSKVTGNVSSTTDPREIVLGYFDAGQIIEKQLFIAKEDLPTHLQTVTAAQPICWLEILPGSPPNGVIIVGVNADETGYPNGYTYTTPECGDCRIKGGVTQKPDFWP